MKRQVMTGGAAVVLFALAASARASVECKPGQQGYSGGDGSSVEQAVVICGADSEEAGVRAEREYLAKNFPDHKVEGQSLLLPPGRAYDRMDITLADGDKRSVYFDITAFFGIDFR